MSGKVILTPKNGEDANHKVLFRDRTTCLVGRSLECQWQLESPQISRRHCLLEVNPPHVKVRDLNSTNGTFINGLRLVPTAGISLSDGDEIQIGGEKFEVHIQELTDASEPQTVSRRKAFKAQDVS